MNDLVYEHWHFPRPELVASYLDLLLGGTGDPIALQSPRRWGKTTFLRNELMPALIQRGALPVYIDVWQNRDDVVSAINYGLQEAIDDLQVPASGTGKSLKTPVRKLGLGGVALELGEAPARRRPEQPLLLIDWLLKTLVRTARRPVVLLFDEIQELASARDGESAIAALRSAITKSKAAVRVIFTGSDQGKLVALFSRTRAALYEGASILAFPHLDERFVRFVVDHAKGRFHKSLLVHELAAAFERLQYQPRALIDLVLYFASSHSSSLTAMLDDRVEQQLAGGGFESAYARLTRLQRLICQRAVSAQAFTSAEALAFYAQGLGKRSVSPGSVGDALKSLVEQRILSRLPHQRGAYQFDDPLLAEWIRRKLETEASSG